MTTPSVTRSMAAARNNSLKADLFLRIFFAVSSGD